MEHQIHKELNLRNHALGVANHLIHALTRLTGERAEKTFKPISDWDRVAAELKGFTPKTDDYGVEKPFDILGLWLKQWVPDDNSERWAKTPAAVIIIGATYLRRAVELSKSDRELAWSYLASASYWAGITRADDYILDMLKENSATVVTRQAAKGGDAKDAIRHAPLREYAYQLAREKRPEQKGWRSVRQAANKLAPLVTAFANANNVPMRSDNLAPTLTRWLRAMPDAIELFANLNKRAAHTR